MTKLMDAFSGAALDLGMRWQGQKLWGELTEQFANPARTQAKVLAEILTRNADTMFGAHTPSARSGVTACSTCQYRTKTTKGSDPISSVRRPPGSRSLRPRLPSCTP